MCKICKIGYRDNLDARVGYFGGVSSNCGKQLMDQIEWGSFLSSAGNSTRLKWRAFVGFDVLSTPCSGNTLYSYFLCIVLLCLGTRAIVS